MVEETEIDLGETFSHASIEVTTGQVLQTLWLWLEARDRRWFSEVYRVHCPTIDIHSKYSAAIQATMCPDGFADIKVRDEHDRQRARIVRLNRNLVTYGLSVFSLNHPVQFLDLFYEDIPLSTADIFGQCVVYGRVAFPRKPS